MKKLKDIFTVEEYRSEVHLSLTKEARDGQGFWSWNYDRLQSEYPEYVQFARSVGFTNKSRNLYAKELGIPLKPDNPAAVKVVYESLLEREF